MKVKNKIGTWKVCVLYAKGKLANVVNEMERVNQYTGIQYIR
jgi:hypothetical protein